MDFANCRLYSPRKPDPSFVLDDSDILYVAGELDVVEFVADEFGLALVNQVRVWLLNPKTMCLPYLKRILDFIFVVLIPVYDLLSTRSFEACVALLLNRRPCFPSTFAPPSSGEGK